jgi:hypothetical protein
LLAQDHAATQKTSSKYKNEISSDFYALNLTTETRVGNKA